MTTERKPPTGRLNEQAWMAQEETVLVMQALHDGGGEARFVGGCVRDALCNRKVVDIDIATPLKPEAVIERLTARGIRHAPTGLKHGTVTALCKGRPFEITTLRIDAIPYGRHADVVFTDDWEADAARRDFTFNALSATREGEVFDYFGGIRDLADGRVLFVGDPGKRIEEDVLRILRFFRFTAWYGRGLPDPAALRACAAHAKLIPRLSAERLRQETLKILTAPHADIVWRMMMTAGVSGQYLPEATGIAALERLCAVEAAWQVGAEPLRRLASLLEINKPDFPLVVSGLKLSNAQGAALERMAFPDAPPGDAPAARRFCYRQGPDMARALLLLAAARDAKAAPALKALYDIVTAFRPPRFPLTGDDVAALGLKPGPRTGQLLKAVEDWWLEGDFAAGRTACLEQLKQVAVS
jgi:poly(A) polymerase